MNMKYQNQKPDQEENKEGGDITQLDGSPDPTAVSRVAMGGTPQTDDEHAEVYNTEWINRLKGEAPHDDKPGVKDIDDAYAMLFEGLAGIMRCK
jgi:hypothetical protein